MIKLIASDLDGTLLHSDKEMPNGIFDIVEGLYARRIIFTPASGRQLPNLIEQFAPVLDKIAIIAENGGLVWHKGKVIYSNPTPREGVKFALDIIRKSHGLYPLLSCEKCSYYETPHPVFVQKVEKSYTVSKCVKNLDDVAEKESVIKISIWDEFPPCSAHGGPLLSPQMKGLRTITSGWEWMDVSGLTANKGEALSALIGELNISPEECEAYGDHMNDLEMLSVCGNPFVPENAFEGLKKIFKNTIPSNDDEGVIKRLKEHLK